ncbi:TAXI family TRAP transporter solute-binding subunit [Streptomyces sp. 7-21]|jgi:TRAP transporter TAXI family solute receptor|uniref:TAXI family TRAP transporter solute-binding subunit n=1 Tax=Streptomyces sp. 7-21 TaxID=2802283 RepID=UPI00191DBE19|nr:TAXI family TRAP transporter solute-binding subunit [Streptomyces sp. 7-21]MBL1067131.1 TAXI family TRAP transporter solute-binding subunit [Streptomyces sp. 7-21]
MAQLNAPSRRVVLTLSGGAAALAVAGVALRDRLPGGEPSLSGTMRLSTGVPTGVYSRYGQLLRGQLARDVPGLRVELLPSEGSVENLRRLAAGEADFAIATADSVAAHVREHSGGQLQACVRLYDDYMQLVVREESPVWKAADLAGMRVGVGQDASGVQLVARQLLAAAGLDMDQDLTAVREGINAMPRMLEAGRLDAFFWSGGLPTSAVEQLAGRVSIRFVPLGDLLPALRASGPAAQYYRAAVMPPDAYPAIAGSRTVDTVAMANLLVTAASTDSRLTEQVTRSVINGRDRIGQEVHAAQRVDLRTAIYTHPLELHPGAVAYYRSVKS